MVDFTKPDVKAIQSKLDDMPIDSPSSDKGRFFNLTWWRKHYKEVEQPVLEAISRMEDTQFARRVSILDIARNADADNGNQLQAMGFTVDEITRYVTRAMNKRLKRAADDSGVYYVIRNNKLIQHRLEYNPEQ